MTATYRRFLTVLLTVGLLTAGIATPVAAQEDDDGLLDTTVDVVSQVLTNPGAAIDGIQARFDDPPDNTAAESEAQVRRYFNERSGDFESWGTGLRFGGAESRDVVRLVYKVDGETDSHIAQATVSDGEYRSPAIVESTDRTVDYECALEGAAARSAPAELETIYEDYAGENRTNVSDLQTRLGTQYAGKVDCTEVN